MLGSAAASGQPTTDIFVNGRGPVELLIPSSYDPAQPIPLIVMLHARNRDSTRTGEYLGVSQHVESRGFLYLAPDGTSEPNNGPQFWNANDHCCDFTGSNVNDSAYIRGLVEQVRDSYSVDLASIHFIGHSNGGSMSYRMACDHAEITASILSLAGADYFDASLCQPQSPVHIVQAHGTNDEIVLYNGGCGTNYCVPSAMEAVANWVANNGCSGQSRPGEALDLDVFRGGNETTVEIFDNGCREGGSVELWTMEGAPHIPQLAFPGSDDNKFSEVAVDWLLSHRKAEPAGTSQEINYGLAGGWFNTETPGQGFLFDFLVQDQFMFVAAFTFDTLSPQQGGNISGAEQRWFTAQGNYQGSRAELTVFQTRSGVFDDPTEVESTDVGTMVIEFLSCTAATLTYDLPDLGLSGTIPISKLLADTICSRINSGEITLSGKSSSFHSAKGDQQEIQYGLIGGWFNPDTSGQGFLFDFQPDTQFMFAASFTFDGTDTQKGSAIPGDEQRWFTAQGNYQGSRGDLTIFQSRNGIFDDPAPVATEAVGTMSVEALNCTTAEVTYELPGFGLSGVIPLTKLLADEICSAIDAGEIVIGVR